MAAESDPANAEWQRDLWVSYWRKAYDTLASMASAGLFVSTQDQQFLERFRAKLNERWPKYPVIVRRF